MDKKHYEDFFIRASDVPGFNDDHYLLPITSPSSDRDKKLFSDALSKHVDYFDPTIKELKYDSEATDRHIKADHLTAFFINNLYEIPEISEIKSGEKISFDKYIEEFVQTSFSNENRDDVLNLGTNRLRFVVGNVGGRQICIYTKNKLCN